MKPIYFTNDEPLPNNNATMKAFLDMVNNIDELIERKVKDSWSGAKKKDAQQTLEDFVIIGQPITGMNNE